MPEQITEVGRFLELASSLTATGLSMLINLAFVRGWISTPAFDRRVSERVAERLMRIETLFKDTMAFMERQTATTIEVLERATRAPHHPVPPRKE